VPTPLRRALAALALVGAGAAPLAAAQGSAGGPAPGGPGWDDAPQALATVHADHDGDTVPDLVGAEALVAGRVTAGTGLVRADVGEVYVQDGTGGLRVVLPRGSDPLLTGDSVLVSGTVGFRDGTVEMEAPAVRVVPGPLREVRPVRLPNLPHADGGRGPDLESHEGELVEVEGRVVQIDSTEAGRVLVLLSGTDLVQVFAYRARASPVQFRGVRSGDYVRVRGVAVQHDRAPPYTGSYVVLPLAEGDVQRAGLSPAEYKWGAAGIAVLLLFALLWAVLLRRQVRKRSRALRLSEARYGHLLDAAADPVLVLDVERGGELVEANRAAQRAFGVLANGDRPGGRAVLLAELAAGGAQAAALLAEADRTGAATATLELRRPDGEAVPYEVATRRVREGTEFVAVARDVEERRAYEQGLVEAVAAAEEARARAEDADRLKASILTNMSHEIRTPLTAVLGYAEVLCEEVPEDLSEFAESVRSGGQRLLSTLNDLLDFAQLEAEQEAPAPEPLDVVETVREAVAPFAAAARDKGVGLQFQSEAAAIPAVHSAAALARVAGALVGNAVKFTAEGSVRVSLHAGDGFFALRVEDSGVGISEAFLPDLFEPFKQESDGHGRSHEGSGLGLAIAQRLVALMGGEVRVWSQRGEGTLFEVALPLSAPGAPAPPADDDGGDDAAGPAGGPADAPASGPADGDPTCAAGSAPDGADAPVPTGDGWAGAPTR
jgi:PAS domain S-box-containing protein